MEKENISSGFADTDKGKIRSRNWGKGGEGEGEGESVEKNEGTPNPAPTKKPKPDYTRDDNVVISLDSVFGEDGGITHRRYVWPYSFNGGSSDYGSEFLGDFRYRSRCVLPYDVRGGSNDIRNALLYDVRGGSNDIRSGYHGDVAANFVATTITIPSSNSFLDITNNLQTVKPNVPTSSDSFVKIINNIKPDSNTDGTEIEYLEFTETDVDVFQFPLKKIYVRKSYNEMFNYIRICFSYYRNIIITGQPGIGKTSFMYYLLYKLMNNDDWKSKYPGGVYVYKGKKHGNPEKAKAYKLIKEEEAGYNLIEVKDINSSDIYNSIIIADTCNFTFEIDNTVISISSPDGENNSQHIQDDYDIELYFESLEFEEVQKWFKNCIGFDCVNVESDEFKDVCERYGNIPRLIYFHYLYRMNYNGRDYWSYYEQLIDSVAGKEDYNTFLDHYNTKDYLKEKDLSNIILKYDFTTKNNPFLGKIYEPKPHLKFISTYVEDYIMCKFYPPKNNTEYNDLIEKYISMENDNEMKRFASKHLKAYELATKKIIIDKKDDNFQFNSKKHISIYHPEGSEHFVYFILDKNNYFDLILNGVFIKIQHNVSDDVGKLSMKESIKEYSENEYTKFHYAIIDENISTGNIHTTELGIKEEDTEKDSKDDSYDKIKVVELRKLLKMQGLKVSGKKADLIERLNANKKAVEEAQNAVEEAQKAAVVDRDNNNNNKGNSYDKFKEDELRELLKKEGLSTDGNKTELIERLNTLPPPLYKLPEGVNIEVFAKNSRVIYLMRNCYYKMLNIICPGNSIDVKYPYQKNYLIFGHKRIGKTVLAAVIKEYIHQHNPSIEIITIREYEQRKDTTPLNPYIVISDGEIIGEDDYADAKMIILLATPSDEKYKTFQSKRFPLVMYIPPFTKEEIEKVIILEHPRYHLYEDFPNYFMNKSDLDLHVMKMAIAEIEGNEDVDDIDSYLEVHMNEINAYIQQKINIIIYNEEKVDYRKNYEYYGGVIGNYKHKKEKIMAQIGSIKTVEELIKGINVSSIAKCDYNDILIYETFEDDVTKSEKLTFISETIKDMVKEKYFKINPIIKCKEMIDMML